MPSLSGNGGTSSTHSTTRGLARRPETIQLAPQPQRMEIAVSARTVLKVLALVLLFALFVQLLGTMRDVFVWVGAATFLAVALNPAVTRVERVMSRRLAVLCVFVGFVVLVAAVIALLVTPLVTQVDEISKAAPSEAKHLAHEEPFASLNRRFDLVQRAQQHASSVPTVLVGATGAVVNGVLATVSVLFLTLFMLFEIPRISELLLSQLRPPAAAWARRLGGTVNRNVGGYVAGNLLISVLAGCVTTVTLLLLGVPYALTLGVAMAIFDLIPLVGATVGAAAVVLVALATEGTTAGIVVVVVMIAYQQIENHLVQPLVYRRTVQLSPFVVLVSVLAGAALLGVLGALIAIPVAGTLQVIVADLLQERAERLRAEVPDGDPTSVSS